jgi:hypothetical protein
METQKIRLKLNRPFSIVFVKFLFLLTVVFVKFEVAGSDLHICFYRLTRVKN